VRCHWEKLGVLGPIYGLASQGLSDRSIANKLDLTEVTVNNCVSWLLHFLKCRNRAELVLYASPAQQGNWGLRAA
jgi:DNA-binding NarL/FixJ family response regulator